MEALLLLAKTLLMGKSGIWRVFELGSRALEEGLIGSCAEALMLVMWDNRCGLSRAGLLFRGFGIVSTSKDLGHLFKA
jgi:hypothetical protein